MQKQFKVSVVAIFIALAWTVFPRPAGGKEVQAPQTPCPAAQEHTLPQPGTVENSTFENLVLQFLQRGDYKRLGWCVDKSVRDTGPFQAGVYYGTHPAVRVFYSPKAMAWLTGGRQGPVPDGAMIIKEHYPPPSGRYAGMPDDQLPAVSDWTVMIRDGKSSKDGWYWGEFFDGMQIDSDNPPFDYPWAGFGLYCLRCHATAEKEHTFISLDNIKGFPGQPIIYHDDGSWRSTLSPSDMRHGNQLSPRPEPSSQPDPDFLNQFNSIPGVPLSDVQKMPSETYDHLVAPASGPGQFLPSVQCMSCHSGLNGPFGPTMFLPSPHTGTSEVSGANVSPYGEWRWSPMGLAGRDPVFFAQLESEFAFLKTLPSPESENAITGLRNACLTCHGVMGKRQLDTDNGGGGDFQLEWLQITDRKDPHFKYGALARDGISCTACHRTIQTQTPAGKTPLEYFLENSITGNFSIDTPDKIFGPFKDDEISPYAMENATGIKPQYDPYIQSSRMCGSCHTIELPVVDGAPGQRSLEQVTYLEWLNSQYQTEFTPGANSRSCQSCHMPGGYHSVKKGINVDQIRDKIAIIMDQDYPDTTNQIDSDKIAVPIRKEGYARHQFLGLNVFLLEMFDQFWEVLGVRKSDYMSGSNTDLADTIDNYAQRAEEETAKLELSVRVAGDRQLAAELAITNLAGHRFPSGVGFRRAFIEVTVVDSQGNLVWASGRTNDLGIIVDRNGQPLASEFFAEYQDSQGRTQQRYQPHYEVISSQDQVQIYEELTKNADGKFTTSFIRRDETVKDNRLLPIGWTMAGPDPSLNGRFLASTFPEGDALSDPDYRNGLGQDRLLYTITLPETVNPGECIVRATLYYQSMPPYYLNDRFKTAPDGDATKRLYYLASNLDLAGSPAEDWKLRIASIAVPVSLAGLPPVPPGSRPIVILAPQSGSTILTTSVSMAVRLSFQVNRNSFRAFLNGREMTRLFLRASARSCAAEPCDLVASPTMQDGLKAGKNELKVEVRGPGANISRDATTFTVK